MSRASEATTGSQARVGPTLWFLFSIVSAVILVLIKDSGWGRHIFGAIHLGILLGLRRSLQDQFLAISFGVDAVIRGHRRPEFLVVDPDDG